LPERLLLTVTFVVWVVAARFVLGVTVKELLPPAGMLLIGVVGETVNAVLLDRETVNSPVGWLPVLVILTDSVGEV
jgi:hypothetical protein